MKDWYLVSYDIRDDKRLRKAARILAGYGTRVQYSIFRCHLSKRDVERLRWDLAKVLASEDGLLITGLCQGCMQRIRLKHGTDQWPEEPPTWIVL